MLKNPSLEARAETLGDSLRCLQCQNETIEMSEAGFAHDMRLLIRERIKAGESDGQITLYLRSRYGDFIMMRPPFADRTILLWLAPLIALLIGAGLIVRLYRPQARSRRDDT